MDLYVGYSRMAGDAREKRVAVLYSTTKMENTEEVSTVILAFLESIAELRYGRACLTSFFFVRYRYNPITPVCANIWSVV